MQLFNPEYLLLLLVWMPVERWDTPLALIWRTTSTSVHAYLIHIVANELLGNYISYVASPFLVWYWACDIGIVAYIWSLFIIMGYNQYLLLLVFGDTAAGLKTGELLARLAARRFVVAVGYID